MKLILIPTQEGPYHKKYADNQVVDQVLRAYGLYSVLVSHQERKGVAGEFTRLQVLYDELKSNGGAFVDYTPSYAMVSLIGFASNPQQLEVITQCLESLAENRKAPERSRNAEAAQVARV